jgi:hypothetical protein
MTVHLNIFCTMPMSTPTPVFQSQLSLPLLHLTWPSPTQNAVGVFRPLVTATGNISGAAAPALSRLQPNVVCSGFHLSRCVLFVQLCYDLTLVLIIVFGWAGTLRIMMCLPICSTGLVNLGSGHKVPPFLRVISLCRVQGQRHLQHHHHLHCRL